MIKQGTNILKEHANDRLILDTNLQQINFLDRRVYKRAEGVFYPSVTTILQYMPRNQFFENWLKDVGHNSDLIASRAAKEGTQVHEAAELLVKGEQVDWIDDYGNAKYSELVWSMICRFYEFWTIYKPELLYTERFVYSDEYQYAGTADLIVRLDKQIWLIDIKSSKHLHGVYNLQLAAYAKAIEETLNIKIERTGILWLKANCRKASSKKGVYQGPNWQLKPIDEIDRNFNYFKSVYSFYKEDHPTTEPIYTSYPTSLKI